jgi:hypothetical protein
MGRYSPSCHHLVDWVRLCPTYNLRDNTPDRSNGPRSSSPSMNGRNQLSMLDLFLSVLTNGIYRFHLYLTATKPSHVRLS